MTVFNRHVTAFTTRSQSARERTPLGLGRQQVNPEPCPWKGDGGGCGVLAGAGEVRSTVADTAAHCHGEPGENRWAEVKRRRLRAPMTKILAKLEGWIRRVETDGQRRLGWRTGKETLAKGLLANEEGGK